MLNLTYRGMKFEKLRVDYFTFLQSSRFPPFLPPLSLCRLAPSSLGSSLPSLPLRQLSLRPGRVWVEKNLARRKKKKKKFNMPASTSTYLDPSTASAHLKSYSRRDGLSLAEIMDSQQHGGLTYNDILGKFFILHQITPVSLVLSRIPSLAANNCNG
jgi:hypothetical protein